MIEPKSKADKSMKMKQDDKRVTVIEEKCPVTMRLTKADEKEKGDVGSVQSDTTAQR